MGSCSGKASKKEKNQNKIQKKSSNIKESHNDPTDCIAQFKSYTMRPEIISTESDHPMAKYVFPRSSSLINITSN